MPTYLARGLSARLGTLSLADTVSPKIISRKGEAAKQQVETAERLLRGSRMLSEVSVPFPGQGTHHSLNWLGNAPFIQVQALQDPTSEEDLGTTGNPKEAKALVLHVNLSDRTYVSGLYNKKTSLKIEVFFNGQLSSCWLMSTQDVKSGVRGHHQVFAGTRVDFFAERPWVILPSGMVPHGSFEMDRGSVSVPQRWQDICSALQNEAHERGVDKEGEAPPTARFLKALATMPIPDRVQNMQKPDGKVFGTVDVVITAGEGKKLTDGIGYLKAPKRMPDENFPYVLQRDGMPADLRTPLHDQTPSNAEPCSLGPSREPPKIGIEGGCHGEQGPPLKRRALTSNSVSNPSQTGTLSSLKLRWPHPHDRSLADERMLQASGAHSSALCPVPIHTSGSNYPHAVLHMGGMCVDPRRFGLNTLPLPHGSPQLPARSFHNNGFPSSNQHWFAMDIQTPRQAQCFVSPMYSLQGVKGLPLMSVPLTGRHPTWPVPPVGLYSVPRKPTRNPSPPKNPIPAQLQKCVSDILVARVVILGPNKTVLVDRRWNPPKRLTVGLSKPASPGGQRNLSASMDAPLGLTEHKGTSAVMLNPAPIPTRQPDNPCKQRVRSDLDYTQRLLPPRMPISSMEASRQQFQTSSSSQLSACRKRKTLHLAAVNKSRSFPSANTDGNPLLNQGCFIAYAESKDETNKQGVLRQVRSERAGVFQEDYVVFATRFFVGEEEA